MIVLFITILAMVISWRCNKNESMGLRILYVILSGIFSVVYLLYFLEFFKWINKCCHYC